MASRLFVRLSGDFVEKFNARQQVRWGHKMRGRPPTTARTLEQRLTEMRWKDPEVHYRVDIGYKHVMPTRRKVMAQWIDEVNKRRNDPELERKSRKNELLIDLDKAKTEWWELSGPNQIRTIADHYEIFEHMFGDAYFTPVLPMSVSYDLGGDLCAPVHRGNHIKPRDTIRQPDVAYAAKDDSLWTLLLTTPDGSFVDSAKEVCHWFVGNIPGDRIAQGDLLIDYMRPIPSYGIGYCRYVFVLYKQEKQIDYSEYKKEEPCLKLAERNWSTLDFYRKHQDHITPAGLAFFQADWDSSLSAYYRNALGVPVPRYEYDFPPPHIRKEEWFPKGKAFNLYLDKYRDPKDINKDFLMKKMKTVHPFRPPPPPLKFPNAIYHPPNTPSWLSLELKKERLGWGRVNEIA